MINIGIIGYGKMGKIRYRTINEKMDSNVIIKSIYDPENKIRGKLNVSSSDEIINDPNIDAIYKKFNYLNKPLTIKALEAGKHKSLLQKPPALNLKDVLEIQKIEKNKLILMYGFNHRHHASISYMKEEINKKHLEGFFDERKIWKICR